MAYFKNQTLETPFLNSVIGCQETVNKSLATQSPSFCLSLRYKWPEVLAEGTGLHCATSLISPIRIFRAGTKLPLRCKECGYKPRDFDSLSLACGTIWTVLTTLVLWNDNVIGLSCFSSGRCMMPYLIASTHVMRRLYFPHKGAVNKFITCPRYRVVSDYRWCSHTLLWLDCCRSGVKPNSLTGCVGLTSKCIGYYYYSVNVCVHIISYCVIILGISNHPKLLFSDFGEI